MGLYVGIDTHVPFAMNESDTKRGKGEVEEGEGDIAEMEVCLGGMQRARGVNKSVDDSDAPHCNK